MSDDTLREAALDYHRYPTPGKISVTPTKAMATQRDLALAYSPGVAEPAWRSPTTRARPATSPRAATWSPSSPTAPRCWAWATSAPLAGKPVMEGKGCLFKKFAGIDVFDIELAENDPDALIDTIARMEPTFGGINLEDIKAPECFYIEKKLRERMKIPVFHDDQHGTAIVAAAAILNGAEASSARTSRKVKLVASGAGAAALACLDLIVSLGLPPRQHLRVRQPRAWSTSAARSAWTRTRRATRSETNGAQAGRRDRRAPTSSSACRPAACSSPRWSRRMARDPIILAMANPTPEIMPEDALAVRPDAIIGTGRSDYPNQVNNVLCFPFIFRGALDVGATTINEEMKLAAVRAHRRARACRDPGGRRAGLWRGQGLRFGARVPDPQAVRSAADRGRGAGGGAGGDGQRRRARARSPTCRPTASACAQFVYQSGSAMQPVFAAAKQCAQARGLRRRRRRARAARRAGGGRRGPGPAAAGRPPGRDRAAHRRSSACASQLGATATCVDLLDPAVYGAAADAYYQLRPARRRLARARRASEMRSRSTLLAAMLVRMGEADAMLCGTFGRYRRPPAARARRDRPARRRTRRWPRCRC